MEEQSKIKVTELGQKSAVEVEEPLDRKLKLKKAAIFFLMQTPAQFLRRDLSRNQNDLSEELWIFQ